MIDWHQRAHETIVQCLRCRYIGSDRGQAHDTEWVLRLCPLCGYEFAEYWGVLD